MMSLCYQLLLMAAGCWEGVIIKGLIIRACKCEGLLKMYCCYEMSNALSTPVYVVEYTNPFLVVRKLVLGNFKKDLRRFGENELTFDRNVIVA